MESVSVLERAKSDSVKFVKLQFTDLFGFLKSVAIPVEQLAEALEKGVWFDGSSIQGFARIFESDMVLKPDASTYAVLPWLSSNHVVARLLCDVFTPAHKPFDCDPRFVLKNAVLEAEKMGFSYNTGPELEFFLFEAGSGKPSHNPVDRAGYFDSSFKDNSSDVRKEIVLALQKLGFEVEMSHHEVAEGQQEIDFRFDKALATADRAITLKSVAKAIASSHGMHASFMPKPVFGQNGSGMHVHQSLFFNGSDKNAFFDASKKEKLSDTALSFVAGQLEHAREISAIVAPTVNSYKRLVPGYEAPVYICWAHTNRSALIRIPSYSIGREHSTRAELRCPDPSANPYLAFAAMLWAGLDGINRNLQPPKPVEEDVYLFSDSQLREIGIQTLPGSLSEALQEMRKSRLMRKALGEQLFEKYLSAKEKEWDEYRIQVTDWERQKYFEVL